MTNDSRARLSYEHLHPLSQRLLLQALLTRAQRMQAETMCNLLRRGGRFIYRMASGITHRIASLPATSARKRSVIVGPAQAAQIHNVFAIGSR